MVLFGGDDELDEDFGGRFVGTDEVVEGELVVGELVGGGGADDELVVGGVDELVGGSVADDELVGSDVEELV